MYPAGSCKRTQWTDKHRVWLREERIAIDRRGVGLGRLYRRIIGIPSSALRFALGSSWLTVLFALWNFQHGSIIVWTSKALLSLLS